MSIHELEHQPPVRVHVASSDVPMASRSRKLVSHFGTVVLTAAIPADDLLPLDPKRVYALVQAGGNNAVICESLAEAQNAANQATGLPNPIGYVLPVGNTQPTKIPGSQRMWCAAAAYPTQVTWVAVQEAD